MKYLIVFSLCLVSCYSTVYAQPKSEELIRYRQSAMMFMRWNIGVIKQQLAVAAEKYDQDQVRAAARAIAAVAATDLRTLFSEGTETGVGWKQTRVKPAFFTQPEQVGKRLSALRKQAGELVRIADGGDPELTRQQFDRLFKACRACHQDFRSKH